MLEYSVLTAVPNIICIVLAVAMALKVGQRSPVEHKRSLFTTFILMAVLSLCWWAERSTGDYTLHMSIVVLEYVASATALLTIICFTFHYSGYDHLINRRNVTLLAVAGAFAVVFNATNEWHHLFYSTVEIKTDHGLYMMQADYGPLFLYWMFYCVGLLLLSMVILLKATLETSGAKRKGVLLIVLGIGIYTASGTLFALIERDPRIDMLSIGLSIAALLVYQADRMSSIVDQYNISIREAIYAMDDGVIILDPKGRTAYANNIAADLVKGSDLGPLSELGNDSDLRLTTPSGVREYGVKRSRVVRGEKGIGDVIVLRDITERKAMERQLAVVNHRLDTLTKMLRHDIKNDLIVLNEHLGSLMSQTTEPQQAEKVRKAIMAADSINECMEIARHHQLVGSAEPVWQDLRSAIEVGIGQKDLGAIVLVNEARDLSILADAMFPKVFHNLLDNTLRHGGKVGTVHIDIEYTEGGANIIWEDDGVGIPEDEKDKIFFKGYGKNTGQGLYLTKDILNMTGIDIIENGVPGEGARFVLIVPKRSLRREI